MNLPMTNANYDNAKPPDMSSAAIRARLEAVSELFRLTSALSRARRVGPVEEQGPGTASESPERELE